MALSVALKLLEDRLSCTTYKGDQHSNILIKENDPSAKLKSVDIIAKNGNWFSLNVDEGRKCSHIHSKCPAVIMSPLLKIRADYDHHRACDGVIIIENNNKLTIIYVDLKSQNPTGYEGQFRSTRQFIRYAIGLLEEFTGYKLEIEVERYVIFHCGSGKSLNKKTTIPKRKNSSPNAAYKKEIQNGERIYLNEILQQS